VANHQRLPPLDLAEHSYVRKGQPDGSGFVKSHQVFANELNRSAVDSTEPRFSQNDVKTVTSTLFGSYPKGNNPEKKEKEAIEKRLLRSEILLWWDVVITP